MATDYVQGNSTQQLTSALRVRFDADCAANGIVTDGQHFGIQQIQGVNELPQLTKASMQFHQRVEDVYMHPDDLADVFEHIELVIVFGNTLASSPGGSSQATDVIGLESDSRDMNVDNQVFLRLKQGASVDDDVRLMWGKQLKAALLKQLAGSGWLSTCDVDSSNANATLLGNASGVTRSNAHTIEDHMFIKETQYRPIMTPGGDPCEYPPKRTLAPPYRQGALNIMLEQQPAASATFKEFLGQIDLGFAWKRLAANNALSIVLGDHNKEYRGGLTIGMSGKLGYSQATLGLGDLAPSPKDSAGMFYKVVDDDSFKGSSVLKAIAVMAQAVAVAEDIEKVSDFYSTTASPRQYAGYTAMGPPRPGMFDWTEKDNFPDKQMLVIANEEITKDITGQHVRGHMSWSTFFRRMTSIEDTGLKIANCTDEDKVTLSTTSGTNSIALSSGPYISCYEDNSVVNRKYFLYKHKPTDLDDPLNDLTSDALKSQYFFKQQPTFELPFDLKYTIMHNLLQMDDDVSQQPIIGDLDNQGISGLGPAQNGSHVFESTQTSSDLDAITTITTGMLGAKFPQTQLHDALRESTSVDPREVTLTYKYETKVGVGLNPSTSGVDGVTVAVADNAVVTVLDPEPSAGGTTQPNLGKFADYEAEGMNCVSSTPAGTNTVRFMLDLKVTHSAVRAKYAYGQANATTLYDE